MVRYTTIWMMINTHTHTNAHIQYTKLSYSCCVRNIGRRHHMETSGRRRRRRRRRWYSFRRGRQGGHRYSDHEENGGIVRKTPWGDIEEGRGNYSRDNENNTERDRLAGFEATHCYRGEAAEGKYKEAVAKCLFAPNVDWAFSTSDMLLRCVLMCRGGKCCVDKYICQRN